ncbi:MAG TPA: hypothetical protein VGA87_05850, partial [Pyrinomonadaceae bacterium]
GRGLAWLLNPAQFAGVLYVMLAVDLATFVGWAQAVAGRGRAARVGVQAAGAASLSVPKPGAEHEPR